MKRWAIPMLITVLASNACSDRAIVEEDPFDTTSSALTQKLRLPFPAGHTWYICQSYVGFSHKSNRPFDIGWTKASCNAANNDTGGKPITAPGAGKISRMPSTAAGGDFMCLTLTGGGSIVLGHVKPEASIKLGSSVAAGQKVATVRTSTDPAGQNAGIAHLHYEAFAGDSCYVGAAQAFTGAWRMQCAPDLPYVATANFYNGTGITACAPDAGAGDAGSKDARANDGAVDGSSDATVPDVEEGETPAPAPATTNETPESMPPPPGEDGDGGGCTIGKRFGAPPAGVIAIAIVAVTLRRRRRPEA